jgi:hypothetical protein
VQNLCHGRRPQCESSAFLDGLLLLGGDAGETINVRNRFAAERSRAFAEAAERGERRTRWCCNAPGITSSTKITLYSLPDKLFQQVVCLSPADVEAVHLDVHLSSMRLERAGVWRARKEIENLPP